MPATAACIARLLTGLLFLFAGLAKIADPVRFLLTLRKFDLVPETVIRFTAVYIPWVELLLGLCMVAGLLYRTSALMLAFLNAAFTIAILSVILRGMEIDCGCFGLLADVLKIPDQADFKAVIRNIIIIAMCLYVFFAAGTRLSLEDYLRERPSPAA